MVAPVLREQQEGTELRVYFVRARHLGANGREQRREFGQFPCRFRAQNVSASLGQLRLKQS